VSEARDGGRADVSLFLSLYAAASPLERLYVEVERRDES
jgi:hypothetical protein